jgi:hypothetical protein
VLLQQLGQNLVLDPELLLQSGDLAVLDGFNGLVTFAVAGEGSGPVLEEFPLPSVEQVRLDAELVASVGHRLLLQQMESQDGHLVGGRVMLALRSHEQYLRRECSR